MESSGVIPSVRPTVAAAETVSNRTDSTGRLSIAEIMIVALSTSTRYIIKMQDAALAMSSSSLRPKHSIFFLCLKVEITLSTSTAAVVIFIPPAVEPVEPPISIRQIIRRILPSENAARSTVLKPAVRIVTDWNMEARSLSEAPIPRYAFPLYSKSRKPTVPPKNRIAVITSTSFVCTLILEQ